MATRESATADWQAPINLGSTVNSSREDTAPCLSEDGLQLVFISTRNGQGQLWISRRESINADWSKPERLSSTNEPIVSSQLLDSGRTLLSSSETEIHVALNRGIDKSWEQKVLLPALISPGHRNTAACFCRSTNSVFFESDRPGGQGGQDLWMSRRIRKQPAERTAALSEETVKALVSEAAGIPNDDWAKLTAGTELPTPDSLASKPLSFILFSLDPAALAKKKPEATKDFRYLTERLPKPNKIGQAMWVSKTKGYASFIQPEYVTKVTVHTENNTARGEVAFEAPDLYAGRVNYVARKSPDGWRVEGFHLPNYGISIHRTKDDIWKRVETASERAGVQSAP